MDLLNSGKYLSESFTEMEDSDEGMASSTDDNPMPTPHLDLSVITEISVTRVEQNVAHLPPYQNDTPPITLPT